MKNVKELREKLSGVFDDLQNGRIDVKTADSLANISGKMISSAVAQIKMQELTGDKTVIPFLKEPKADTGYFDQ
jgi:hypothetical protein